jgi:hypothetical protein
VTDASPAGEALPTTDTGLAEHISCISSSLPPATLSYGPWSPTVSREERGKQLRSMAALALVFLGPDNPLWRTLRSAEVDPTAYVEAQSMVERLPSLTRRRLISTFAAIMRPGRAR